MDSVRLPGLPGKKGSRTWTEVFSHLRGASWPVSFQKDAGGSKQILQFSWTSQMSSRLYCGDPARRQHFTQLLDVAALPGPWWNQTRVFALFRNQW